MLETIAHGSQDFTAYARRCRGGAAASLFAGAGSVALVALIIAAAWAAFGVWTVLPLAGVEVVALMVAGLHWSRHGGDFERIYLSASRLVVVASDGDVVDRREFNPAWVKVVASNTRPTRMALRYCGREYEIGRHLAEGERARLMRELLRRLPSARA